MSLIYKILLPSEWDILQQQGCWSGAPVDLADGFIHFSTSAQVRETALRHFSDAAELVLLAIDTARLEDRLKWEPSRGGDLFPHLYAALPIDYVETVYKLSLGSDGLHIFPSGIEQL